MSYYVCRTAVPEDKEKIEDIVKRSRDPGLLKWLHKSVKSFLEWEPHGHQLMVVTELDDERIDGFVAWSFGKLKLQSGSREEPVWIARTWRMSGLTPANVAGHRSYEDGRAVELIYHAFNNANSMELADVVVWPGVMADLARILKRAEFQQIGSNTWSRDVWH